jgi:hypothetical protein
MAPHGGAGSYPKGPGPSRKRPQKTFRRHQSCRDSGPIDPRPNRTSSNQIRPTLGAFRLCTDLSAWPTRRGLCFTACKGVQHCELHSFSFGASAPSAPNELLARLECSLSWLIILRSRVDVPRRQTSRTCNGLHLYAELGTPRASNLPYCMQAQKCDFSM